ncbi:MAG: SGNH/GDSL hydrolase family protein [Sedimenticola sp.]
MSQVTILCFGHSFIRRLGEYCSREGANNLSLDSDRFRVSFEGIGGATILPGRKSLQNFVHVIRRCSPDIIFLQIGENDLSSGVRPEELAKHVLSFGEFLAVVYRAHVIIGQLLPRTGLVFNGKVRVVNHILAEKVKFVDNVVVWRHRGFYNPDIHFLLPDNVHLNEVGQRKLCRSLKYAVLNHANSHTGN